MERSCASHRQISDWTLMRHFLAVARTGSLLRASKVLGITQPTIGRKMDMFERELGEQLFIRTTHGMSLTEAGRRVQALAENMERLVNAVNGEAGGEALLSGVVRFRVTDGIGGYWLPLMLEQFHIDYPHITIDVSVGGAASVPTLSKREADITVVYQEPTEPEACVLATDYAVGMAMASRSYLDRYGTPQSLEEMLAHRYCAHDLHFTTVGPWAPLAQVLQRHRRIVYRSNSSLAVCQAVRRGIGISYMPIGVRDREPDLVLFDIEGYAPRIQFWLVCHRDAKDVPAIRAVVDYVKEALFRGHRGSLSRRAGGV